MLRSFAARAKRSSPVASVRPRTERTGRLRSSHGQPPCGCAANPSAGLFVLPAKEALASDDQIVSEGRDGFEKGGWLGGHFLVEHEDAALVEDAQVHRPGVQIDAT